MAAPASIGFFREVYRHLYGWQPYPWQESLFVRLVADDWPPSVTAPTGAGKTSLITIWLTALAWQAEHRPITIPRRLVWVVNRRVVVDQATAEAEQIRNGIESCAALRAALEKLCLPESRDAPLAISTLRGEFADNREWVRDPSRAAIIVGTVDMMGSRLLFSGYGDSFRVRAHHAGLLGHDSVIVNDEAHLTPAFAKLLESVEKRAAGLKPIRTIRLSATMNGAGERFPVSFDADLARSETFAQRFHAPKRLRLHPVANNKEAMKRCVDLATQGVPVRTIVFVTKPEEAATIASGLRKAGIGKEQVAVLTGVQRGDYRDGLKSKLEEITWLVATSAGEVGIDITCLRLITLLDSADHLLQRFGRLNRFGEGSGDAHLVYVPPKEKETRERATIEYLRSLPPVPGDPEAFDISVSAVFQHPPPREAISAEPAMAALQDWIVDRWTFTSIDSPAKPKVEAWLHGKDENLPRTAVVWRDDVSWLVKPEVDDEDREKALRIHRIAAPEKLEEPTSKLLEKLNDTDFQPALLLKANGKVECFDRTWPEDNDLHYATLILQPGCGGLEDGMFSAKGEPATDVADSSERRRFLAERTEDGWTISGEPLEGIASEQIRAYLKNFDMVLAHQVEIPSDNEVDDEPRAVLIYARRPKKAGPKEDVLLTEHQEEVKAFAGRIAARLDFDSADLEVYEWAGLHHDSGKAHEIWQRAMNCCSDGIYAKSRRRSRPKLLGGLRHELVSLNHANPPEHWTPFQRDLALHLIACHHGWARPHFRPNACDPDQPAASGEMARESALRFARLQRHYGPWGLAYLEAVFRAADWLASERSTPEPEEQTDAG